MILNQSSRGLLGVKGYVMNLKINDILPSRNKASFPCMHCLYGLYLPTNSKVLLMLRHFYLTSFNYGFMIHDFVPRKILPNSLTIC